MDHCLLDLDKLAISALGTQKFSFRPENIYQLPGYKSCISLSIHSTCLPSATTENFKYVPVQLLWGKEVLPLPFNRQVNKVKVIKNETS